MEHKEMGYYEEFSAGEKNIMYIDFSNVRSAEEYLTVFEKIERVIENYPKSSLYTITNLAGARVDTVSKENFVKYAQHNKPYVKKGVLIGLDGVKKMIVAAIIRMSGRNEFHIAFTKEKAIEWILQQD